MADTEKELEIKEVDEAAEGEDSGAEKTYSLEDVARRWECSQAYIKREYDIGFPMYKNKKGKWRVKESDLLAWEEKIEEAKEQKEREQKKIKRGNMAAYIIGGIVVAIFGVIVLIMFTNI